MTKNELNRFQEILAAKVAELEPSSGNTGGSRSREAPINWKRYRRLPNAPSRFVDSTVASATFATRVRRFVESRKAALGHAWSATRRSTRSGSPRYPGLNFVSSARKRWTAILER